MAAVEDGFSLLKESSERVFIMGQSLGGVLTMTAASRYPFDGVIGISTPFGLLNGWQAQLARPGLLKFISLFAKDIKKPSLDDNPETVDMRAPENDLDPYPRYVTRALAEALELVRQMQSGLPQISAPLLLIQGRHDAVVEKNAMQLFGERVASTRKETLWLENTGHVVTLSDECEIAFNAVPQIDLFAEDGYTKEEIKMANETRKLLHAPGIAISATCVRIPAFFGHSMNVWAEFERPISAAEARQLMASAPGLTLVDDPAAEQYPTPLDAAGNDLVLAGRLRADSSLPGAITFWTVTDSIRKGAATNVVQIIEEAARRNLIRR
ncbi:alpha/beta fold hydrolase [bacterium]|nr:MAG: alpha/beta fold hydrolase [bacterium]